MTRSRMLGLALLLAAMAMPQFAGSAFSQDGPGWITLFDGKNLDQWQGDGKATFVIEDGAVTAKNKKDDKTIAYLVSKQSFKDFVIHAEFWVSDDANTGVWFRCSDPANVGSKTAYEANVFDTRPNPDYATGAIPGVAKAATVLKTGGKWNTYEITVKGPKFTLVLNGTKTVDGAEDSKFPSGPIALQFGQGTVKFRKVAIKPM